MTPFGLFLGGVIVDEFVQAYLYIESELIMLESYLVNENGEIFSKFVNRKLKPRMLNGYVKINLLVNQKQRTCEIHRIVASTFIKNESPSKNIHVNHIDGCKENNHWANLEWTTPKGNSEHAFSTGLNKPHSQKTLRKLTDDDVRYIRSHYIPRDLKYGRYALARMFEVDPRIIFCILKGETYKDVK